MRRKSRFARMQVQAKAWDKLSEEAKKHWTKRRRSSQVLIRRVAGIARIQAKASPAKSGRRFERRHRLVLAKTAAARYQKQIQGAEAEYMAAKVEYNDSIITYGSRYWAQAAAFAAAVVTEQRLVHRAMCKNVLTAAVTVAKQRQQQIQQGKLAARDTAGAARKRQ